MLKRNIGYSLLGQSALMLLSIIATKFVFSRLGGEMVGIIYFAITISGLLIFLFDLGISPTVTKEVAANRTSDKKYVAELIGTTSTLVWILYVFSVVAMCVGIPIVVVHWLNLETMEKDASVGVLALITAGLLIAIPRSLYAAVLNGYEKIGLWSLLNVLSTGLQHLGTVVILVLGGGAYTIAVWYLVSNVIGLVPFISACGRLCPPTALKPKFSMRVLEKNYGFGLRVFSTSVVGFLLSQADKLVISKFMAVSLLGYYAFAQGMVSKAGVVSSSIAVASFPALSSDARYDDAEKQITLYGKLEDLCYFATGPVAAGVGMLGLIVMRFVFGETVLSQVWIPMIILTVANFSTAILTPAYMLSLARNMPGLWLRANTYALFLVVPSSVVLIHLYGLTGAALSGFLYSCWLAGYFGLRFTKYCAHVSSYRWFRRFIGFIALWCLSYGVSWAVTGYIGDAFSVMGILMAYGAGTVIYSAICWFNVGADFRNSVRQTIYGVLHQAKVYLPVLKK